MSNIERKYSYLDEGVFPEIGEYGVTYLTLYSSGAGNVYDGWMWDPDRVHYSETERTFGYRNPDYPDYCWDDEVVVDLSNAQTRQETSDFAQGRITSFNTNVSSRPIVLQDIDITGLDEEEREALATTVLFSAIPLVKDAYIQAMVEVQMKVNLSPTNTNGMVRVEAFYILNDESDRTMRPNPVHTFAVSTANERHTLSWLYWNPALKHEDHNYIGVKLLCTGGTAEIGISDDPEYGDAMITLTSAGLTGDHIDSGRPVSLDIYGKSIVPPGYKLKESDYTVLCTYDTGEVYEVTRLCEFTPPMGSKLIDPVTTLTANYQGLTASMSIVLAQLESIELVGLTDFYEDTYTLNRDDYIVMAYYDTGDIMDVTDDEELIFDPPMGTVINDDTTLTATYSPEYMHGSEFEDSLEIVKHTLVVDGATNHSEYPDHLIYSLYDNGFIKITGNANNIDPTKTYDYHEVISLPISIIDGLYSQRPGSLRIKWEAEGDIGGFILPATSIGSEYVYLRDLIGFENVSIKPHIIRVDSQVSGQVKRNPIAILFDTQEKMTSDSFMCLRNISYDQVGNIPVGICTSEDSNVNGFSCAYMFENCKLIENLNFCSNMNMSNCTDMSYMFHGCTSLSDISGIKNWNVSRVVNMDQMFLETDCLESARDLSLWNPSSVASANWMFARSRLKNLVGIGSVTFGSSTVGGCSAVGMFNGVAINDLIGITNEFFSHLNNLELMFGNNTLLTSLNGSENIDLAMSMTVYDMFEDCLNLDDISAISTWDVSNVQNFMTPFNTPLIKDLSPFESWDLSSATIVSGICPGADYQDRNEFLACYCSPSMWSQYSNSLADNKIMPIYGNKLILTRANVEWDTERTHSYYWIAGMFGSRTLLLITDDDPNNPKFVNVNAFPIWYRARVTQYIVSGMWIVR